MFTKTTCRSLILAASLLAVPAAGHAQFLDSFEGPKITGWDFWTGDGDATMDFVQEDGFARIVVDATKDRYGVWWAIIKRDVTASLDLEKLKDPAYELRVEARVRAGEAPRRVNFMLNTSRTTNFHEHLREYYIPDTDGWHTISFTTQHFDAHPGDQVFVQFGVTDWGPGIHHVDLDYYRADVVRRDQAAPDLGEPLLYHPPVADPASFAHHLQVAGDSVVNTDFPDVNFNDWHVTTPEGTARVLTVDPNQFPVLRWDFSAFQGKKAAGAGLLELTTYSVAKGGKYIAAFGEDLGVEFGVVHVIEILGGDPAWDQEAVTYHSLLHGENASDVFNPQMTIDLELNEQPGGKTYFTLPRPVMQRLLDGTTKGLVVRPLGSIVATFYASEDGTPDSAPKLHFSTKE